MKRSIAVFLSLSIACSSLAGCYGKFALTRKVYAVNGEVKDKYLRSLVTWVFVIVPVYGISALADFILFNTMEFWSGRNPVAQGEKEFFYVRNGEHYQVNARKSGTDLAYRIRHYGGNALVDTMEITWDLTTGESKVTTREGDRVTRYTASVSEQGVRVEQLADGQGMAAGKLVALYR